MWREKLVWKSIGGEKRKYVLKEIGKKKVGVIRRVRINVFEKSRWENYVKRKICKDNMCDEK